MSLHPDFPIIEGHHQMTTEWSVELPTKFNRRVEDSDLVIWKPGFTIWVAIWNNDKLQSPNERLARIKANSPPEAYDFITDSTDEMLRYAYRVKEDSNDNREAAFYCYSIGVNGHVQMAVYFDSSDDVSTAKAIWRSLSENTNAG